MSGAWPVAIKNATLDNYAATYAGWASLHTSDPGAIGASEGGAARVAVTWSPSSGGILQAATITFTGVPAGTYTWIGFWSASSGGTFGGKMDLPAAVVFPSPGSLPLSGIAWNLNATASA